MNVPYTSWEQVEQSLLNWNIAGGSLLAGAGPAAKGIGAFSGEVIGELVMQVDKSKKHDSSKKVETFLQGFDPEEESWIRFTLSCFTDLFIQ